MYNFPRRSYWLRRVENHDRKEYVPVDEYTIEHIMPQNRKLSKEWQKDLGPDWERVQRDWLHTIGNLTLTGYNPEYSDHSFALKRDMEGGFRQSPLRLNDGLGALPKWDEDKILKRADRVAVFAAEVWSAPIGWVEPESSTVSAGTSEGKYNIKDFPYLAAGRLGRSLFDVLRGQVLELDPCVEEDFNKLYVAYKAETNFVDVVPLASGLNLFLNLEFHELVDPRGLAQDVSEVGHWGNGNVRVHLADISDLLHVMALVRQALEAQMDGLGGLDRRVDEVALLGVAD